MSKTLKQTLSIILTILMIVTTMPFAFAAEIVDSGYCGASTNEGGEESVTWTLDSDGLLTISGTGDMADSSFDSNTNIKTVVIKDGVTSIGWYAFEGCTNLESVKIPDSVTSIGDEAFSSTAYYNDETNWENGVLYIGNHLIKAKEDISRNYSVKPGTKTIADAAFAWCTSLASVTIPDSVTSIGNSAFLGCESLASITIGNGVTSISSSAFALCTSLASITVDEDNESYSSKNGVLFNKNKTTLIQYPAGKSASYTIPDSVTDIGYVAFYGCTSLESVTIPDSVTSIGEGAFGDCTSLTLVHYLGTSEQWDEIEIGSYNDNLTSATRHYCTETEATVTCTEDGYTAGWYCADCEEYVVGHEEAAALGHSFTEYNKSAAAKCGVNAKETASCDNGCGATKEREVENSALEHSFTNYVTTEEAKCGVAGKEEAKCDNGCGATDEKDIPALEHVDKDGDYVCDYGCGHEFEKPVDPTPDTPDEPTDTGCDHLCHQSGFMGFIWKIISFLQRLFGIQQYCDCGVLHYDKPIFG